MSDCITQLLQQKGVAAEQVMLGKSSIPLGMVVIWGNSRITYKVENQTALIVCYERIGDKPKGLKNGFSDLLSFFHLLKNELPELTHLAGKVDALGTAVEVGGLTNEKLHRFYGGIYHAPQATERGEAWYSWELAKLGSFRKHYQMMKAKA